MKTILITKNHHVIVDDRDYAELSKYRWYWSKGYAYRNQYMGRSNKKQTQKHFAMHREILEAPIGISVDHINGNSLDNRRVNLRLCNQRQNCANQKLRSNNTSGYKGVYWSKVSGKWMAYIKVNYKRIHLGLYDDISDASAAYNTAALEYFGEFARVAV